MNLETEGSANAGTPEAPAGTVETTSQGSSVETNAADPFLALDADTREWVGKKGIKDVASLAKSARSAETMIGKAVVLPEDGANPEEWGKVWSRLGKPETADGYELSPPESMPDTLPYDAATADLFKASAHKAGLTKTQAKALHDEWIKVNVEALTANTQRAVDTANAELAKAWGGSDTDAHKENLRLADRGIRALGGDELLASFKRVGLLGPKGEVLDARVAMAFAKAGKELGVEGSLVTGTPTPAENPFTKGAEGIDAQMRLYKTDPARALMMIRAAGKDPSDFGIRAP